MHAISGQKRVRDGDTYRSTAPPGECVLSWGAAARHTAPKTRNLPEQVCGFPAAGSEPAIAAAGAAAPGTRVRAARRAPADAVTREGSVAATPLQVKRDPQLNKSEGRPFPCVIESRSGRIGRPPDAELQRG
jgi:hypothetical protein